MLMLSMDLIMKYCRSSEELPPGLRSVGLTVGIKQNNITNEYWFNGGSENKRI